MMGELAHEALHKAQKVVNEAEIYVESEKSLDIDIQKDKVGFAKKVYSLGIGVRVITQGRMGFAYTTNLELMDETIQKAVDSARANLPDENFKFASFCSYPEVQGLYDKRAEYSDVEEAVDFGKLLVATVHEEGCQPTSGGYALGIKESVLLNSQGVECKNSTTMFSGFISVNAQDGEGVSTAHESHSSCQMDLDPEKIAKKACRIALDSRGGGPVETGNMMVVLDHQAAAGLLSTFTQAINGDNVQRGRSIYAGKEGEQVAAKELSIYDDGTIKGGLYSACGDGEGTPSQKTTIIKDGILQHFIYDIYTAQKGNIESTGNGMRASYADMPSVSLSNLEIEFENYHDLSDVRGGFMVTDVLSTHCQPHIRRFFG